MRTVSRERSLLWTSVRQAETTECPELLRESVLSFSTVTQISAGCSAGSIKKWSVIYPSYALERAFR